jgi:hypothetical protein
LLLLSPLSIDNRGDLTAIAMGAYGNAYGIEARASFANSPISM